MRSLLALSGELSVTGNDNFRVDIRSQRGSIYNSRRPQSLAHRLEESVSLGCLLCAYDPRLSYDFMAIPELGLLR